ncbi:MAG: cation diffusion facilitator family transporter [Oscillospiraceae bacterium]|nr:cation diffusion facilitator family transporter [Oscillospiraceae bacterium]
MTEFLTRTFIKNYTDIKNPTVRSAYGKVAGIVGIFCNLLLFAGKLAVGTVFGSIAITADAINNLSDASSSIVTLIGFKMAEKPADDGHPYGHARIEYLSGLIVAFMILLIGVELLKSSFAKILAPTAVQFSVLTVIVLLGSIMVKLWMALFNRKLGKKIDSATLIATAMDSRNDVITTTAVLLASIFAYFTGWQIDGYVGLVVALFILYSGVGIIKDTIDPILGAAPDPEVVRAVAHRILSTEGVLGMHDLMVHDYGPGRRFASVHVEMDADKNPLESHDIIDNLERAMMAEENIQTVIHYDPILTNNTEIKNLKGQVSALLAEIDTALSFHDFRVVKGPLHTNLIFDVVAPHTYKMTEAALKAEIDRKAKLLNENYYTVVTVDRVFCTDVNNA